MKPVCLFAIMESLKWFVMNAVKWINKNHDKYNSLLEEIFESKEGLWKLFVLAELCRLCFWANGDMRYKQRASIGKPGPTGWIIIERRDYCFLWGEVTIWSMVYANDITRERLISDSTGTGKWKLSPLCSRMHSWAEVECLVAPEVTRVTVERKLEWFWIEILLSESAGAKEK